MTAGGAVGVAAAFIQTIEKIRLLENKDKLLACDLNSVFSCSSVLNSWQSSVFGFPNSLLCLVLFTIFVSMAAAGLMGASLPRLLRLLVQAASLLTLGFALWLMAQSIFVIGSLCILCLFCFAGLVVTNWGWLRLNAADLPIGERGRALLARGVRSGADIFGWFVLVALVVLAMLLKFY